MISTEYTYLVVTVRLMSLLHCTLLYVYIYIYIYIYTVIITTWKIKAAGCWFVVLRSALDYVTFTTYSTDSRLLYIYSEDKERSENCNCIFHYSGIVTNFQGKSITPPPLLTDG